MYIFYIVDIVLGEERHVTTRLYWITYICSELFWRIADILILAIIFRCIAESSLANLARKLAKLHKLIFITLTFLSIAAFAMATAQIVYKMIIAYLNSQVLKTYEIVTVTYHALYLFAAILAGFESFTLFLRSRSKVSTLSSLHGPTPKSISPQQDPNTTKAIHTPPHRRRPFSVLARPLRAHPSGNHNVLHQYRPPIRKLFQAENGMYVHR